MDLHTITLPQNEARLRFLDYRRAVHARHREEDITLMKGYRQLSIGKRVLSATETIRAGGFNADRTPKLALCRADADRCALTVDAEGTVGMRMSDVSRYGRAAAGKRFHFGHLAPRVAWNAEDRFVEATAIVPIVPPQLRPVHALDVYHILWEAEWSIRRAPKDPALLKHIAGDLFVVLVTWDLTELERAVLLGTRAS